MVRKLKTDRKPYINNIGRNSETQKKLIFIGCLFAATYSLANEYKYELSIDYAETDVDTYVPREDEFYSILGKFYLNPVDDSKGPLAEAAFLQRASYVDLSYQKYEAEFKDSPFSTIGIERKAKLGDIGATYIFKDSGWILSGGYHEGDADSGIYSPDLYGFDLAIGKYVAENTTLSLAYNESTESYSTAYLSPFDLILRKDFYKNTSDGFNLSLKHVGQLWGSGFSVEVGYGQGEEESSQKRWVDGARAFSRHSEQDWQQEHVNFTFYPADNWGVGLGYSHNDQEGWDTDYYSFNLQWFVTNNIAVTLGYSEVKEQDWDGIVIDNLSPNIDFGNIDDFVFVDADIALDSPVLVDSRFLGIGSPGSDVIGLPNFDRETVSVGFTMRF